MVSLDFVNELVDSIAPPVGPGSPAHSCAKEESIPAAAAASAPEMAPGEAAHASAAPKAAPRTDKFASRESGLEPKMAPAMEAHAPAAPKAAARFKPKCEDFDWLQPGKFVWLQGLTSRPDLNGKAVTVLAAPEDGRVAVRIAGCSLFGTAEEDIRVKVAAARKSLFSGT